MIAAGEARWAQVGRRVTVWVRFLGRTALQPRALSAPAGATSILIGMAAAGAVTGRWNWLVVLLGIVAAVTANLVALLVNDLADANDDDANLECTPGFSGGTRALQSGLLTRREMCVGAAVLAVTSAGAAIALASITRPLVLLLGALALLGGLAYSSGPRLVSRGFGDIMLGLCAGLIPVLGGWVAMSGELDHVAWVVGCAQALAVGSVCFALHSLDADVDAAAGKRTLAARVASRRLPWIVAAVQLSALIALVPALGALGVSAPVSVMAIAVVAVLTFLFAADPTAGRLRQTSWVYVTYECGSVAMVAVALARSGTGGWLLPAVLVLGGATIHQVTPRLTTSRHHGWRRSRALAVNPVNPSRGR